MEIPALGDLLDLQEVDLEIDRLLERRQSLPELQRYRAANEVRTTAEATAEELREELRSLSLDLDKEEGELEILERRLDEAETRLYAGGMNAKETEHKRMEVRSLGAQKETMEERVLGLLDRKEELEGRVEEAVAAADEARSHEQELEAVIKESWKEIDRRLAREEAKKAEIVSPIPEDLLETYEHLRRTKDGVAVGRLEGGQCQGCHLHLSPTEQAEAREHDPPRCVHCMRILVF